MPGRDPRAHPPGAAMSNVVRTFAQLEAVCLAAGCVVGFLVGLVQVWRDRRT